MLIKDALYANALACAFFNRTFLTEPTKEFIGLYGKQNLFDEWPIDPVSEMSREGLAILGSYFGERSDHRLERVREDYRKLFVGPTDIVPVWESVWTSKDRLLFGEPTLEVRDFYARYGIEIEHKGGDPDDHIGYEFAFMGHLLHSTAAALESSRPEKRRELSSAAHVFFSSHLGAWAPECLSQIAERAECGFYRGVARLGLGYLGELAVLLKVLENK